MRSNRASVHAPAGTSPWMKAQIDTYEAVAAHALTNWGSDRSHAYVIANVSQSCNRGENVSLNGVLKTATSSCRLYDYQIKDFLSVSTIMAAHGYEDYRWGNLSETDCYSLVGNVIMATTLATLLVPCFVELGFLADK